MRWILRILVAPGAINNDDSSALLILIQERIECETSDNRCGQVKRYTDTGRSIHYGGHSHCHFSAFKSEIFTHYTVQSGAIDILLLYQELNLLNVKFR